MSATSRRALGALVLALAIPVLDARADDVVPVPAGAAQAEPAPVEEPPAAEAPAEDAPTEEAPAEDAPTEEAPDPGRTRTGDDAANTDDDDDSGIAPDDGALPSNDGVMWGGQVDGGAPRAGRKRKPFEPDTALRLTGDELAARGATNLGEALDLLPEVAVRPAGRGGMQADVRGSRRNWLKVLVDGIPVDDPYYGSFDISSIPVTDIVEIRISSAPASPIDGFGGAGGLIEVTTLRALGPRRLGARAQASSAPTASGWVTGRANLSGGLGLRVSAGGIYGDHGFDVRMPDGTDIALGEDCRAGNAALRLESETPGGSVGLDIWVQKRGYTAPPGEDDGADVLVIDDEQMGRVGLWGETFARDWRLRGQGYFQLLTRDSRWFDDASLDMLSTREALSADREGFSLTGNRGLGSGIELVLAGHFDTESAKVDDLAGTLQGGRQSIGGAAAGLQWKRGAWRAHASAGVAIPDGSTPWPEAKLAVTWAVADGLELQAIGARKGRLPTLRERYQLGTGNEALDPEAASHGELRVRAVPVRGVRIEGAAYAKLVEQMIRTDMATGMLANIGDVRFFGGELEVVTSPVAGLDVAGAWRYIDAYSDSIGEEPLDFLPANKVDGWVTWRLRKTTAGATARVRWIDERQDQGMTLPAYVTTDVSGFYRVRHDLRATLKVDNVLDERFTLRANGYRDPGRVIMLGVEGLWE